MADETEVPAATHPADAPTVPEEEPWKYQDPIREPDRKGMLLSDQIEMFCGRHLLIKRKYERKQLRPAAYTLRIGSDYVDSKGKRAKLGEGDSFYIEPNSIAYVSTFEELDLPYYIAARFNLRVKWVYKGILLGTGPQVEPGYNGYLSCPLFNLTDTPIKVTYEDDFATIDFERTSNFCAEQDWHWIREHSNSSSKDVDKLNEIDTGAEKFLLFKQEPYKPLKHLPEWIVVSSLMELSNEVKTWRNIGIGIVLAFFGLTLSLLSFQNNLYHDVKALETESRLTRSAFEIRAKTLESELSEARETTKALESRLKTLESRASAVSKPSLPRAAKQ